MGDVLVVTSCAGTGEIIQFYLSQMGFASVLSPSGQIALEQLNRKRGEVSGVIISNEKIGMSAPEIWRYAKEINPAIWGVVFTTSWHPEEVTKNFREGIAVLQVPFYSAAFKAAVMASSVFSA